MKIPGPDHSIPVEPNPNRITVTFNGETIADTTRPLGSKEISYPMVHCPHGGG